MKLTHDYETLLTVFQLDGLKRGIDECQSRTHDDCWPFSKDLLQLAGAKMSPHGGFVNKAVQCMIWCMGIHKWILYDS